MSFPNDYVGIPFLVGGRDRQGIDCWGLLRLVYRERRSIDLPCFDARYDASTDHPTLAGLIAARMTGWFEVKTPQRFDGVLLSLSGAAGHIGIMVDARRFLHAREGHDSAVERIDSGAWRRRVAGIYRYEG